MGEALLQGVRVVDLAGEPGQMGGRILADLGAEVVKIEPPGGDPLRGVGPMARDRQAPEASLRFQAWNAGKCSIVCSADDPRLDVRGLGPSAQPVRIVVSRPLDLPDHPPPTQAAHPRGGGREGQDPAGAAPPGPSTDSNRSALSHALS